MLIEEQPIYTDYVTTMYVLNVTKVGGGLLKRIVIPKDNGTTYHMNYALTEFSNQSMQCFSITIHATAVSPFYGESMSAVANDILLAGNS